MSIQHTRVKEKKKLNLGRWKEGMNGKRKVRWKKKCRQGREALGSASSPKGTSVQFGKGCPSKRKQPYTKMHSLASKVWVRFQPQLVPLARSLYAVNDLYNYTKQS